MSRRNRSRVKVKLEAALDFVKGLKGQDLEVSLSSLSVTCDELRGGVQTINLTVDPDRAAALIAKAKSTPGVVEAGWTSGAVEMDRAIRFAAADWRDGDKVNRDKLASAISGVLSKTLAAKPASSAWSANTGKLKLTFKRPSPVLPALAPHRDRRGHGAGIVRQARRIGQADAVGVEPGHHNGGRRLGPKLNVTEDSAGDEEGGEPENDNGSIEALTKELKGQRWDADKSVWK